MPVSFLDEEKRQVILLHWHCILLGKKTLLFCWTFHSQLKPSQQRKQNWTLSVLDGGANLQPQEVKWQRKGLAGVGEFWWIWLIIPWKMGRKSSWLFVEAPSPSCLATVSPLCPHPPLPAAAATRQPVLPQPFVSAGFSLAPRTCAGALWHAAPLVLVSQILPTPRKERISHLRPNNPQVGPRSS